MNKHTKPKRGLSSIPSVIQLPGGVQLKPMPMNITSYDEEGRPKTFEILPAGETPDKVDGCFLFAQEEWIRSKVKPA
jgi:hypothetical protein